MTYKLLALLFVLFAAPLHAETLVRLEAPTEFGLGDGCAVSGGWKLEPSQVVVNHVRLMTRAGVVVWEDSTYSFPGEITVVLVRPEPPRAWYDAIAWSSLPNGTRRGCEYKTPLNVYPPEPFLPNDTKLWAPKVEYISR